MGEGDVKLPSTQGLDIDIERPTADFGVSLPKVKMPAFGFKGKSPKGEIELPGASVKLPDAEINAEAPSLDIDIEKPSGKLDFNLPDLNLPTFGKKVKKPSAGADIQFQGPT